MKCNETIGQRIGKLRTDRGWTQSELANKLSVKRETVAQWEADAREIKASYIIKLATLFGVSTDYLLSVSDVLEFNADLKSVSKFLGVSEKTVKGLHNNIDFIKNLPQGAEEQLQVLEYFVNMSNGVFDDIAAAILHLRIAKDLDYYMNMPAYKNFVGIHYISRENSIDYMEFKLYKWVKEYCINAANSIPSLFSLEEIENLKQSNSFEEFMENSLPYSTMLRGELLKLFSKLSNQRPGIKKEDISCGDFRFEE